MTVTFAFPRMRDGFCIERDARFTTAALGTDPNFRRARSRQHKTLKGVVTFGTFDFQDGHNFCWEGDK